MSVRLIRVTVFAALCAMTFITIGPVLAMRPGEILADPKLEQRARAIGQELRCLVCQNESIDDSDADLAHDLRVLVRQRLQAGDSDEQVKAYIVARYGNYVLLKPPFFAETYLLWLGPLLFLLAAAGTAAIFYKRTTALGDPAPLSAEEKRRLAALVGDGETRTKDA